MTGRVRRNLPSPLLEEVPEIGLRSWIRIPGEVMVYDILLPRALDRPLRKEVAVYTDRSRTSLSAPLALTQDDLLCVEETVTYRGSGASVLNIPEMPRYREAVEYAMGRMGWNLEDYDVYRCRVEYPVVQSVARISLYLEKTRPSP